MVRTDEAVDSKNQPEYLFSDSTDRQKRLSHHRVPSPAYVFAPSWILPSNTKLKAAQSLAFSTFAKEESTQRPTPHSSQRKDHPGWKDISNSINTVDPTSTSMPHSTPSSTSSSFSSHGQVTRQKNPTIHPPTEEFPTLQQQQQQQYYQQQLPPVLPGGNYT
ncbi:hypothetical protein BDF14DRAFT_1884136 [Spinellus fusiger]|nr:hypothetical protein BDF14DRAFT_1884136 [Spinellus fusiger]